MYVHTYVCATLSEAGLKCLNRHCPIIYVDLIEAVVYSE